MKNISTVKLFKVFQNSAAITESSLNDFRSHTSLQDTAEQRRNRKLLHNAGVACVSQTLFYFPARMYYGFKTKALAQKFSDARQEAGNARAASRAAVKLGNRWKAISNERYSF